MDVTSVSIPVHHCVYEQLSVKVIPDSVCMFSSLLRQYWGLCTLTGSSVLDHHVKNELVCCRQCHPLANMCHNDYDLYIPKHPGWISSFRLIPDRDYRYWSIDLVLITVINLVCKRFGLNYSTITHKDFKSMTDDERGSSYYHWLYESRGLEEKYEFRFISSTGETLTKTIQILVLNNYKHDVIRLDRWEQIDDWNHAVVRQFDADVVQGFAITNSSPPYLSSVCYYAERAKRNVAEAQLEFTFRVHQPFRVAWGRLMKYKERGFSVSDFFFDTLMVKVWRDYVLMRLQAKLVKGFISDMAGPNVTIPFALTKLVSSFIHINRNDGLGQSEEAMTTIQNRYLTYLKNMHHRHEDESVDMEPRETDVYPENYML